MTSPSDGTAAAGTAADTAEAQAHFRRTLVRVMAMQVAALALLGLLQWWYS